MINYYKYLPISDEDTRWGLSVVNVGCTRVKADSAYPVSDHPGHHKFNWKKGRVLNEYQIIYITAGKGIFESDSTGVVDVRAGTIILLFPNERHRYKPSTATGWDEYWIGLKGEIIDRLISHGFFKRESPCLFIGYNERAFDLFNYIIEQTKTENPGYQPDISGAALSLLGSCHAIIRQGAIAVDIKNPIIHKALLLFRSNINEDFSPEIAADQLQVGYSWFRKAFKAHTGLSPGQYFLQLKIERAKSLLGDPSLSTKWIANDLRFESYFYFCRLFKNRTGITPLEYRKQLNKSAAFESDRND
ncbi:AraC family transcriptional regulator [Mucilaginibacter litoreus]|uniref:AraC family transcriptional regulator n=1 Tax=Mucilaginibacter litoreus TaxID=1048221 RepID=A0ABW3ARI9_9SPHI